MMLAVLLALGAVPAAEAGPAAADSYDLLFDATDRVAVVEHDYDHDRVLTKYDSSSAADVESLRRALLATRVDGVCGCIADLEIRLYRGNELLASVGYLGSSVRGPLWKDASATLVSHEALLRWFEERGIDGPRRDEIAAQERAVAAELREARWMAAMPAVLRPLWEARAERIRQDPLYPAFELPGAWRGVLERAYPDAVDRAAALLRWFGYGGPWSGYPSQESIAEELLLEVPAATLLAAIEENAADGPLLEGAARLLSVHTAGDARLVVPPHFRSLLLERVREGGDVDKRERAEKALGDRR